MTIGDIVARTALRQYKHVAWFPCYTAMMREGESECCVSFSPEEISSHLRYRSEVVTVMGVRRKKIFEYRVCPDGLLLLEASGVKKFLPGMI